MIDVGLNCEWLVIYGREEFFNATKVMHNAVQGNPQDLTEEQDVVIQKSTRKGFRLTVTEAIWKGRPFIGGDWLNLFEQVRA